MLRCSYPVIIQYFTGYGFSVTTRVHTKEGFLNEVVNKPRNQDIKDALIEVEKPLCLWWWTPRTTRRLEDQLQIFIAHFVAHSIAQILANFTSSNSISLLCNDLKKA